ATHLAYRICEPRRLLWHSMLLIAAPLSLTPLLMTHFSNAIWATLVVWSVHLASLVFCTVAYRISPFHPLAKYPGPLVCKISKIWFAYVAWGGKQHLYYKQLHQCYGDVVRIGPNELSFCTPDVIAPMMGASGMPKASYWDGQFADQNEFRSLVGLRDPKAHTRLRRIWSRGFTPESLRSYQSIFDKRRIQLLAHLGKRAGQTIDLAKWMSWFAYDIMNDMAFGDTIEMMQGQDSAKLWDIMENAQPIGLVMSILPWLGDLFNQIPGAAKKMKEFREFARRRVIKRLKHGSSTKDLIYHLMDEGGLETIPPHVNQVANDASLVIVAGSDTISPALASLFHYLISNPVAYARLQAEIDNSGLSADDVTELAQLSYLTAAINETLRLVPPLLSGTSLAAAISSALSTDFNLLSYIPEGTTTNVHNYTLQRDPRNFSPSPEIFIPERWLTVDKQVALEPQLFGNRHCVVHKTEAFIPFSFGPADCIGRRLAMQELRMVVFAILQRFNLKFASGHNPTSWEADICDYFVIRKPKLYVVLAERMQGE
ncbi:Cytochrome P450 67, partial [Termitomyces sp. J132]